jgi:hypothetical protein
MLGIGNFSWKCKRDTENYIYFRNIDKIIILEIYLSVLIRIKESMYENKRN